MDGKKCRVYVCCHCAQSKSLIFADSQGNLGQEGREGSGVCSFGVLSLLHCNQSVWMDRKHGKDHEGSGPSWQQHPGVYGSKETSWSESWSLNHWDAEAEGWSRQEWQVREGSCHVVVRNISFVLWFHAWWPTSSCWPYLPDDQPGAWYWWWYGK